jgi:hypothetical protein
MAVPMMQNPYYSPYQMGYTQMGYPQQMQQTQQTQQGSELVTVQTIAQVEQVSLQPGQRKMVMVQNEPIIAARVADQMGLVTTEYYQLTKYVPNAGAPAQGDYITRKEFEEFVASLKQEVAE